MTNRLVQIVCCAVLLAAMPQAWAAKPGGGGGGGKNTPPTATLTAPVQGSVFEAPATIALTADASDANGTVAKVDFYRGTTLIGTDTTAPYALTWTNVAAGSYSLTAKATDDRGAVGTSTAVSIAVMAPPPPELIQYPADGAVLYLGAVTVQGVFAGDFATTTVLVDNGDTTRVATKSAGNSYSAPLPLPFGPATITVTAARRDGTFDRKRINVNNPMSAVVSFLSPTVTEINGPTTIELEAEVFGRGTQVSRVQFYGNGSLLATVTSPPYRYSWPNVGHGNYTLTAIATDENNVASQPATRQITVTVPNTLPNVALAAPADGSTFQAPATIGLGATASDPDGTIARVEFLRNGSLLGSDSSSPYSFNWTNVGEGTYSLAARAVDNRGGTTTSGPVSVQVLPPNAPPTVTLDAPANGATYVAPATIQMAATAADSDGSVARVEFFAGPTFLGMDSTPPYTLTWSNVPAGPYALRARAVDDLGATADSAWVSVTVDEAPPNNRPTAALTAPAGGTEYFEGSALELAATAGDTDGTVAKVEFFANGELLGSDTTEPYALTWANAPVGDYSLTAVATDDGGVVGASAPVGVRVKPIQLTIREPSGGVLLVGRHVLVSGTIDAPFNSGVTVNDRVAALDDQARDFYIDLPLTDGENVITARLTTQAGQTLERTVTVTTDGATQFFEAETDGTEVIGATAIKFILTNNLDEDLIVHNNLGAPFGIPPNSQVEATINFGDYYFTWPIEFTAYDNQGGSAVHRYMYVPHDPAVLDQKFTTLWSGMNEALVAANRAIALTYLSPSAQETYAPVFDALLPDYAQIVAGFSPLSRGALGIDVSEYSINQDDGDGTVGIYFLYFVRGSDGIWRLDKL